MTRPSFLAFAAWHGFSDCVCKKFDGLPQVEVKKIASHMLIIALINVDFNYNDWMQGALQLLRCGADAGMVFKSPLEHDAIICLTPWKVLLDLILGEFILRHQARDRWDEYNLDNYLALANEFFGQFIDSSFSAELMLVLEYQSHFSGYSMSILVSLFNSQDATYPGLVVSMSPALFLD